MAEFVVEFGKDGRPLESDGRLDAAAFHRNHSSSTVRSRSPASTPPFPTPCSTPACTNVIPNGGVRDVADVAELAARNGLALRQTVNMPANNLMLVFERR
jgi:hypothetical protein